VRVRAVGVDAAFANMGFARVTITQYLGALTIECDGLALVSTEGEDKKVVRRSSDRLRRAQELRAALASACEGAAFAFVEVPTGGTIGASAAFGLGIAVGVLASCPVPIIEVSPMEVKAAVAGRRVKKGASKSEVIAWAAGRWPDAPWLRAKAAARGKGGAALPKGRLLADNEHLADALAAVAAGVDTPEFRRLLALSAVHTNHAATSPDLLRPPLRGLPVGGVQVGALPLARRAVLPRESEDAPVPGRRDGRQGQPRRRVG
jgi:hypothetical protein